MYSITDMEPGIKTGRLLPFFRTDKDKRDPPLEE